MLGIVWGVALELSCVSQSSQIFNLSIFKFLFIKIVKC